MKNSTYLNESEIMMLKRTLTDASRIFVGEAADAAREALASIGDKQEGFVMNLFQNLHQLQNLGIIE